MTACRSPAAASSSLVKTRIELMRALFHPPEPRRVSATAATLACERIMPVMGAAELIRRAQNAQPAVSEKTGNNPGGRVRYRRLATHFESAFRGSAMMRWWTCRLSYESFLRERHRPALARRTVDSVAAFFVPHVRSGDRLVDLGCGPGSVTVGFGAAVGPDGMVVGVDLDPGPAPLPFGAGRHPPAAVS